MRFIDLGAVLYVAAWIFGGIIIYREAHAQSNLVRLMAFFAIVVGPLGMLLYLGMRYIGQSIQTNALLLRDRASRE